MAYHQFKLNPETPWLERIVQAAAQFSELVILDSCEMEDRIGSFDWMAAGGAMQTFTHGDSISDWKTKRGEGGWWFGRLNYDVKNSLEHLQSNNEDRFAWADSHFFEAEWVLTSSEENVLLQIHPNSALELETWMKLMDSPSIPAVSSPVELRSKTIESDYISSANSLLNHIQRGDIYEVNYCIEFHGKATDFSPLYTYRQLRKRMAPPMSALFHLDNEWVLSMSPERYVKKSGNRLYSQPIKGTARRSSDPQEDKLIAQELFENPKERAENIMIVDLVRNDLSRVALPNSVEVTELCGIHTFPTVHQMISTVEAEVLPETEVWDVIRASFPMGSMTGAPKYRAMELIEEHEDHKRGIYSGAIGYITPEGDFDFNVVIRSVVYDERLREVSVSVGSALTIAAKPEAEYAECLLKLSAIREVLQNPVG